MHLFPKYPRRETTLRRRREGEFYRPRIMGRESLLARSLVVSQEGRIQERRRIVVYEPVILDHPSFPRLPPPPPSLSVSPPLLPNPHIRRESGYGRTWRSAAPLPGKILSRPPESFYFVRVLRRASYS